MIKYRLKTYYILQLQTDLNVIEKNKWLYFVEAKA